MYCKGDMKCFLKARLTDATPEMIKKIVIFSEKLNGQGCRTNRMFIGQIFTKVIKKVLQRGYEVFS